MRLSTINPAWEQQAPSEYTLSNSENVRNYYRVQGMKQERERIVRILKEAGMKEIASLINDQH